MSHEEGGDKPQGIPFCRVCGSRENEPCPYHTLKSGCPHGVPMVYARSSVVANEGETPRTDAEIKRLDTIMHPGDQSDALQDFARQLERELAEVERRANEWQSRAEQCAGKLLSPVSATAGWTPVSEELPPRYTTVAVCDKDDRGSGALGEAGWRWDFSPRHPTHWMALPDIPESYVNGERKP